jgi:phosphonate transport system substrate-binding protein
MNAFRIASCMADNATATCQAIADYIGSATGLPVRFLHDVPWRQVEAMLDAGNIQLCWICGLPYAWKAASEYSPVELCVAPVMQGARYQRRPVYFSDVVVHRQSRFESFADLRGAAWSYNEPRSHSGFNVVRHHLATLGQKAGYFGSAIESGAHQTSLDLIRRREIDASAIDSTVLEAELRRSPGLMDDIRIIETLGPSPMPPWVIAKNLPRELKNRVTAAFLNMHATPQGAEALAGWGISHFAVPDVDAYEPLLRMEREAAGVRLAQNMAA